MLAFSQILGGISIKSTITQPISAGAVEYRSKRETAVLRLLSFRDNLRSLIEQAIHFSASLRLRKGKSLLCTPSTRSIGSQGEDRGWQSCPVALTGYRLHEAKIPGA